MKIISGILVALAAVGFYVAITMPKDHNFSHNMARFILPIGLLAGGVWFWQYGTKKG
jgi:hypothetical protein